MTIGQIAQTLGTAVEQKLDIIERKVDALTDQPSVGFKVDPNEITPEDWPNTFSEDFKSGWNIGYTPNGWDWGKQKKYHHTQVWTAIQPWGGNFGSANFKWHKDKNVWRSKKDTGIIRMYKDSKGNWQSGLACTMPWGFRSSIGFSQKFGYFEARLKLPNKPGSFPAFWLNSDLRGVHPFHYEVDIIEYFGLTPHTYKLMVHTHGKKNDTGATYQKIPVDKDDIHENYHTYGALLHPKMGTYFYMDRMLVHHFPGAIVDQPMHMIVNLAGHPQWDRDRWNKDGHQKPQELEIDYVRAWQPFWLEPKFL